MSGVLFVCRTSFGEIMILRTPRGAFCFSWKALEYDESNGKFGEWKGEFL